MLRLNFTACPSLWGAGKATGVLFPVSRGISKSADPAAAALGLRDQINAARAAKHASQAQAGQAKRQKGDPDAVAPYQV